MNVKQNTFFLRRMTINYFFQTILDQDPKCVSVKMLKNSLWIVLNFRFLEAKTVSAMNDNIRIFQTDAQRHVAIFKRFVIDPTETIIVQILSGKISTMFIFRHKLFAVGRYRKSFSAFYVHYHLKILDFYHRFLIQHTEHMIRELF